MRKLLLLVFVVAVVFGQQQQTEPPKKARIAGSVVSLTGEPVPRATIRLQGGQPLQGTVAPQVSSVTADDAGKFVENIEPGRNYQLGAQRPGYVAARYGARSANAPGSPLTLDGGADLNGVVITMTPQGVISGRITDQTGDSVQGAMVAVLRRGYQRGVRQLVNQTTTTTNDQGEFRVASLPPGRYYVAAADRRTVENERGGGSITTYYPNATDAQAAAPLDVGPGAELRGIDIRFRTGRTYSIRGKIDLAGAPAGPVTVTILQKDASGTSSAVSQLSIPGVAPRAPDYAFELHNLVARTYVLQARRGSARLGESLEVVVVDADVNGVLVKMGTGTTVSGKVTLEGGDIAALLPSGAQQPAPTAVAVDRIVVSLAGGDGVPITLTTAGARPTIRLTTATGIATGAGAAPMTENGTFVLEGIAPGKYQLTMAPLPQGTYIKSARSGGQDVLRNGLDMSVGGGDLSITISNKAADLSGTVRTEGLSDDKPASLAGLMVTLWSKEPEPGSSTNGVRTIYTDQNGGFRFPMLPPGEYLAAAWEEVDAQLVQSHEFLAQFASEAAKVTLAEGSQAVVEVKLIPVEKIKAAEAKLP